MGERSEQKRSYILKQAKAVFAEKGFKSVTMKDIVEKCGISRGGLYLYFSSTEEIFREILLSDKDVDEGSFLEGFGADTPIEDLLLLFLREQKKEILRKKEDICVAAYEFSFLEKSRKNKESYARTRFETSVRVLADILEEGHLRGVFYCPDAGRTAAGMMYCIEGMKVCARTIGMSENRVDRQLLNMIEGLVLEEEEYNE